MNRLIIVCICSLALSISSFAQAPTSSPIATSPGQPTTAQQPKPGPDLDRGVEGKHVKLTYIEVQVSPTFYTYQAEASIDGGLSTVIAQGKVTTVR